LSESEEPMSVEEEAIVNDAAMSLYAGASGDFVDV